MNPTPATNLATPGTDAALDFAPDAGGDPAAGSDTWSVTDAWRASAPWRKSSRSGDQGACVEMAPAGPAAVAVRDSKDPDGPVLLFSPASWTAFAATPPHS